MNRLNPLKNPLNRHAFTIAFGLGLLAVVWVAAAVARSHPLVLAMAVVIGGVFVVGAMELRQYRRATASLSQALNDLPDTLSSLGPWLDSVHASLQNPVRLRIEGERIGLPGPAITPNLVGLLVMLGMLGTFLGMVVTLNGAVFALEGSSNIQGIRSAFSEPMKGLGLAFGTSVAGVATSAMLGLMASLSRRERLQASQLLDTHIGTSLRGFSLTHQRQETFKALQQQSQALPQVAEQLHTMMLQMTQMHQQLNERLLANQTDFHHGVKGAYTELAQSVDQSLRSSLSQSMQVASDSIRPVVQATMAQMADEARGLHERMVQTTQSQLDTLASQFSQTAGTVADGWRSALSAHEHSSAGLVTAVGQALTAFTQTFEERAQALVADVAQTQARSHAEQTAGDAQRLQAWTSLLQGMATGLQEEWQQVGAQTQAQQQQLGHTLTAVGQSLTAFTQGFEERAQALVADVAQTQARSHAEQTAGDAQRLQAWTSLLQGMATGLQQEWQQVGAQTQAQQEQLGHTLTAVVQSLTDFTQGFEERAQALVADVAQAQARSHAEQTAGDAQRLQAWTSLLQGMATALQQEWQQVGAQTLAQQQQLSHTLTENAQHMQAQSAAHAKQTQADIERLMNSTQALVQARLSAEADWTQEHQSRAAELTALMRAELTALRDAEAQRGQAAVDRLSELQSAVTTHLSTLGTALEAPITRLIATASEAPRAAAEVIGQLRQEISVSVARDNALLEERSRIMETLNALLEAINHASGEQRAAIDALVDGSSALLTQASEEFSHHAGLETAKLTEVAAHLGSSAIEVASLGENFAFAVRTFSESNDKLMASLQRVEGAISQSMTRSDDQLAYYVAQARDIIDLSISSQKDMFEALHNSAGTRPALAAAKPAAKPTPEAA